MGRGSLRAGTLRERLRLSRHGFLAGRTDMGIQLRRRCALGVTCPCGERIAMDRSSGLRDGVSGVSFDWLRSVALWRAMAQTPKKLNAILRSIHRQLLRRRMRMVFVESCTAGALTAAIGSIAGASRVLCGGFAVYREGSKTEWLGISEAFLAKYTDVSAETSVALAEAALQKTPEADVALAITGHFGPKAPRSKDGKIFVAASFHGPRGGLLVEREWRLKARSRDARRAEAVRSTLDYLERLLSDRD